MKISVNFIQKNNELIANCPELNINCYGADKHDAVRRMQTVVNFYIESAKEIGLYIEALTEIVTDGTERWEVAPEKIYASTNTLH